MVNPILADRTDRSRSFFNLQLPAGHPPAAERALAKAIAATMERIGRKIKLPYKNDGWIYHNDKGSLPKKPPDYYREYVVPTEGVKGPGKQRMVIGDKGEVYYTPDHYKTFYPVTIKHTSPQELKYANE